MTRPWKVKWRYAKSNGEMTRWMTFGTYASEANARKATSHYGNVWAHIGPEWQILPPIEQAADASSKSTEA